MNLIDSNIEDFGDSFGFFREEVVVGGIDNDNESAGRHPHVICDFRSVEQTGATPLKICARDTKCAIAPSMLIDARRVIINDPLGQHAYQP